MDEKKAALINSVPAFARGLEILLVDNDSVSLMYLSSMLEQYSFEVTTTELASAALSMLSNQKDQFKLVMVNCNIQDLDILCFMRTLLRKEIPVILITSRKDENIVWESVAEGAHFFLEEPIFFEDLQYVWQPAWYKNQEKKTQKENCNEKVNCRNESQGIKIKEVGDMCRPATINDLHGTEKLDIVMNPEGRNKQKVQEVGLGEKSHAWKLQQTCSQQLMTTDNVVQGGNGRKRTYTYNERNQKQKRTKLTSAQMDLETNYKAAEVEEEKRRNNNDGSTEKKLRFFWNPELHHKFVLALSALGDNNARPKSILKMMNEPDLTIRQVASHLQKYKAQVQRIHENQNSQLPTVNQSSISGRTEYPSLLGRQSSLPEFGYASTCLGIGGNTIQSIPFNPLTDPRLIGNVGNHDLRTSEENFAHTGLFSNSNHPSMPTILQTDNYGDLQRLYHIKDTNTISYNTSINGHGKGKEKQPKLDILAASPYSSEQIFQFPKVPKTIPGNALTQNNLPTELTNHGSQNMDAVVGQSVSAPSMNHPGCTLGFTMFPYLNENQYQNQLPSNFTGTTEGGEFSPVQMTPENANIPNKLPTELTNYGNQDNDAAVEQSVPAHSMNQDIGCTPSFTTSFTYLNENQYQNQLPSKFTGTTDWIEFSPMQMTPENATIPNKLPTELTNHGNQDNDAALEQSVLAHFMNQDIGCTPGFTTSFTYLNENQYQNQLPSNFTGTTEGIDFSPVQMNTQNATLPNKFPTELTNHGRHDNAVAVGQSVPAPSVNQNQFLAEYADILKVLEEDPNEYNCFENELNLDDVDKFREWLRKVMNGDKTDPGNSDGFSSRESQGLSL
ncbi:Two-component response regulator [Quillaja saponaria]|uniref:Two-component response regulator n=1 Tax=Quillaja saponaria TaxID=32244 RepID=A0AAD7LAF8_QUISA|nr:Two-component response regulator [Quillaja saponaria]